MLIIPVVHLRQLIGNMGINKMDIKCEYCGVESTYPCRSTSDMEDFAEDGNEECLNQLALKDGGEKGLRYVILNRFIKIKARAERTALGS